MSRAAKRIKLEPGSRATNDRKHDKHPAISGQFMTSSIDNDAEVNEIYLNIFSFSILIM